VPHVVAVSNNGGTNQTAKLLSRGVSDWSEVSAGPIITGTFGRWTATPLAPVGMGSSIYVVCVSGLDAEVFAYGGSTWAEITDPGWTAETPLALVAADDSVFVLTVDTGVARIWEYSGTGTAWYEIVTDIRYDISETVSDADAIVLNGTLYVSWTETSATGARTRLGAYTASSSAPTWQIIDGTGSEGLNSDPTTYDSAQPTLLALGDAVYLFFTEDTGVSLGILQAYKFE